MAQGEIAIGGDLPDYPPMAVTVPNIEATAHNTGNIGAADKQWAEIHSQSIQKNGVEVGLANADTALDLGNANEVTAADLRDHLDDDTLHRVINDAGTSATETWSASKTSATAALKLAIASNLSDLASASTARTNLGLVAIASSGSASDLSSGTVPAARLPAPGTSTLGGVARNAGTSGQYVTGIDTDGTLLYDTPASAYVDADAVAAIEAAQADTNTVVWGAVPGTLDLNVQLKSSLGAGEGAIGSSAGGIYVSHGTTATTSAAGNDARIPTSDQKAAMTNAATAPTSSNPFITKGDLADASNPGLAPTLTTLATDILTGDGAWTADDTVVGSALDNAAAATTLNSTDKFGIVVATVLKYISWTNLKAAIKGYTDTLYSLIGAVTNTGITMTTARLLGRTTASTGAIEEITVGSGLTLSAGTLTADAAGLFALDGYAAKTSSYSIVQGDFGKLIAYNSASGGTITIDCAALTMTAGDIIEIGQFGAGSATISVSGGTLLGATSTGAQWTIVALRALSATVWWATKRAGS